MIQFDQLSEVQRRGLLFLGLINGKVDLFHLATLLGSYEGVDDIMQLPIVESDGKEVEVQPHATDIILANFKWSEKVKAAEKLASYFHDKSIEAESIGDLWQMAGQKHKACQAFMNALQQYKQAQSIQNSIRAGEKILKLDALSEQEEVSVLISLVDCYECTGQIHDLIKTRTELLDKTEIKNDKIRYAKILRALAIDHGKQGSWIYYKKHRAKAASIFRELEKYEEAAIEFLALTNRGIDEINIISGLQFVEAALEDAERSHRNKLVCKAKSMKAYLLAMSGEVTSAHELAKEALELALKNNLLEAAAYAYRKLAGTYEYASDYAMAKTVYTEAVGFCEIQNIDADTQFCYSCLSWILFRMGEWKKAIDVSKSLLEESEINESSKATAHCVVAYIQSLRGKLRSAEKHTRVGIMISQKEHFLLMYHMLQLPMAKVFELKGEIENARQWYERIVDEWHLTNEKHDVLLMLMDAAVFFLEHQEQESITKCLEIFSTICKATGNNEALGCLAFGLGINARLSGQTSMAIEHFKDARKYLKPLHIPYQLILVDLEIGKCLILLKETSRAMDQLQELLVRTKKYGLAPLTSKITSLINGMALEKPSGKSILTARQLEILILLSKGMSNKEIASELFLSPRTVDMHIRHLFDRLGSNTRWDAVQKGGELGLI